MKEITIVTAFFDIGRENFYAIPRSNKQYFDNFRFWARIKNNLIVYTDSLHKQEILDIRKSFGLEKQTTIVVIDNIYSIEPEIYENIKKISNDDWFIDFRLLPNATSNIPEYSYLMLLKTWFMSNAVNDNLTTGMVAWVDFGFNHGGTLYTNPLEFDFKWEYDFNDKIHFFYYNTIDEKPIFETVRRLNDCIMGCLIVLPSDLCNDLWSLNKEAMSALNRVGLSDDDQLIQLMSYREKPDLFEMHKSEWFLPLKEYGGEHLTIRVKEKKRFEYFRILYIETLKKQRRKKLIRNYIKKTYQNLMQKDLL